MEQNKEQLKKLLEFLDEIVKDKDNYWFLEELRNRYGKKINLNSITQNINDIREALQIRGANSIKYEYIKNEALRNQLLVDNLRMENYALELKTLDETERFYNFCVNAFYQIENLINYYYYTVYPNINDLLTQLENATAHSTYPFHRNERQHSVADIVIEKKVNAFCAEFFPYNPAADEYTAILLSDLRKVRNEGLHRCDVIIKDKEEKLHNFFKYQNFNSIRILLKKVSAKVNEELNKPKTTSTKVVDKNQR